MRCGELLASARTAPLVELAVLTDGGPVLVLSPHPDDESLGCGGLIAACVHEGIPIEVALLTDGSGSHPGSIEYPPAALSRLRVAEMLAALDVLGIDATSLHELGWPDMHAPRAGRDFPRAVAQMVALVQMTGARSIVAAWEHDPHCDHEAAAAIATAAARQTGARHLAYPVWGWTLPHDTDVTAGPALRLDVAVHLPRKQQAVACHRSQHGQIVTDSADSFSLPVHLLDACLTEHEIFFDQVHRA